MIAETINALVADIETKSLSTLATAIRINWLKPYFGAVPYLDAMATLDRIEDAYGLDSGRDIVAYFLANAGTWRGETARKVKAELNRRLKN